MGPSIPVGAVGRKWIRVLLQTPIRTVQHKLPCIGLVAQLYLGLAEKNIQAPWGKKKTPPYEKGKKIPGNDKH